MRAVFLGRKPAASEALRRMVDRGVEVVAVVAPTPPEVPEQATFWRPLLRDTARELGLRLVGDAELYREIEETRSGRGAPGLRDVDLVVSFLYWKKIEAPLVSLPRVGCFNFHPAPLPGFRGRRGYNHAILEGAERYGASVHWVSDRFDAGDLVEVREFPMHPDETALSLERRTMACLLEMFDDFLDRVLSGAPIPREPQGPGRSATRRELLDLMRVTPDDPPELIARKARAFWYPPHTGAAVEIGGAEYTLVDARTLETLGRFLHGSGTEP